MARTNPLQFIQQVRAEVAKITWPTRRETGLTTVMVMIMATLFATFFFLVDLATGYGLELLLTPDARSEGSGRPTGRCTRATTSCSDTARALAVHA